MQLDPRASAAGVRLVAHDVLGSTNAEALGAGAPGRARPALDRGRRGRPPAAAGAAATGCRSPAISTPACCSPIRRSPSIGRSFRSSPRSRSTTRSRRSRPRSSRSLAIKWPNDLLLSGEKFAGILIEGEGRDDGVVVVGIGVNCASHPAAHRSPGDRSCRRRRRGHAGGAVCARSRPRCSAASRNGTAGRALPPSAPTGSRVPPGSARISWCGCPTASSPASSRRSTSAAASCCGAPTAAPRPSPPATWSCRRAPATSN